jgi:hypothetical protein
MTVIYLPILPAGTVLFAPAFSASQTSQPNGCRNDAAIPAPARSPTRTAAPGAPSLGWLVWLAMTVIYLPILPAGTVLFAPAFSVTNWAGAGPEKSHEGKGDKQGPQRSDKR